MALDKARAFDEELERVIVECNVPEGAQNRVVDRKASH